MMRAVGFVRPRPKPTVFGNHCGDISPKIHNMADVPRMTQRTFDDGSPWPPLKPNTLRLYSMRFCPYAQRARLVLAHKKIPHETVNVNLKRKPKWLLERNPKGRVPILEHPDGRIVFESTVVCQYLDEIFPQDRLTPTDPYKKARDRMLVDYCDRIMMAIYQLLFSDGESEDGKAAIRKGLRIYDEELAKRLPDGPFFGGKQPAMVDYLIWPWFERISMFKDYTPASATTTDSDGHSSDHDTSVHGGKQPAMADFVSSPWIEKIPTFKDFTPASATTTDSEAHGNDQNTPNSSSQVIGISSTKYPCVYRWMAAMFELPAVKETMFDMKSHSRFGRSQLTADPDYDMGLENEPPLPTAAKL